MDKYFNDISIFRFSIIAPIINNTHGYSSINEYLDFVVNNSYSFNGKNYKFSKSCIKNWYLSYLKHGIKALNVKTRSDFKSSRKLSFEAINRIYELRQQFPKITGTAIYHTLIDEQLISNSSISLSSLLRFIKINNIERRMFEMENVNDCWQADTSVGPYIKINDIKYRTYIIMFIDDKSRMIMGFDIFLNDTAINMQLVFKNSIKTYGVPKKLFVDNGGPYDNKQLALICASLGIQLIHAKPYSPESKAKQERLFRTIKDGWMNCTDWNLFSSLNDVRNSLADFIYDHYINKEHSVTKLSPNTRWHNEFDKVLYIDEDKVDNAFLHRDIRKVRNDRTIKFFDEYYEVPFKYVGQNIEIRYNPHNTHNLFIYENEKCIDTIHKVDKISNSKSKRKNNIDYSKAINDESNVIEMEE